MKEKDKIAYLFEEAVNCFNSGDYRSAIAAWNEILKYDPANQQAELGIRVAEERLGSEAPFSGVEVTHGMDAPLPGEESMPQPGPADDLSGWGIAGTPAGGGFDAGSAARSDAPFGFGTQEPVAQDAGRPLPDLDLPDAGFGDFETGFRPAVEKPGGGPAAGTGAPFDLGTPAPPVPPPGAIEDIGPLEDLDLPVDARPGAGPGLRKPAAGGFEEVEFGSGGSNFDLGDGAEIPFSMPVPAGGRPTGEGLDGLEDLGPGTQLPPPPPPVPDRAARPAPVAEEGLPGDIPTVPLREPRPISRPMPAPPPRAGLDVSSILKIAIPVVALLVLAAGGYFGWQVLSSILRKPAESTGPVVPTGPAVADPVVLLAAALEEAGQENWENAEAKLQELLKVDPGNARARELLAEIQFKKARPKEFVLLFDSARDRFCRDENWEQALIEFTKLESNYPRFAGEMTPWIVGGYYNWGVDMLMKRQPQEAAQWFSEAERRDPQDTEIQRLRVFTESWINKRLTPEYALQVQKLKFRKSGCK